MCTPWSSLPETPEGRFSVERQTATRIFNRIREAPDPAPIRGPRRRPSRTPADVARGHRGGSAGGLSWAAPTPLRHEAPNVGAPIRRERPPERPPSDAFRMVLPEDRVGPCPVAMRLVRLAANELHHDQIVALLGVLGMVGAVWAELRLRKATRVKGIAAQA